MKQGLKICAGCGNSRVIYKSHGRAKFCKMCWGAYLKGEGSQLPGISKRSSKRAKTEAEYSKVRKQFLNDHSMCMARIPGCTLTATEIHHKKGRDGDLLTNTEFFLPVCRSCHNIIEMNAEMAKEEGFSINRLK